MVETSGQERGRPLGSSYGVNDLKAEPSKSRSVAQALSTSWASLPNNNFDRERERDRLPAPPRPYPASSWDAPPYPYPPARPSLPSRHLTQNSSSQRLVRHQHTAHSSLVGQQHALPQPLISSFGPAGPQPFSAPVLNSNRRPGDWDCPACMAHNFALRSECFKCKYRKPGGVSRRPGDWWCGKCNGHNYAYRVDCFKCGADKSDGNMEPNYVVTNQESGRWAGDWDCPNCHAHCFASRMECFKCGEPKPVDLSTDD